MKTKPRRTSIKRNNFDRVLLTEVLPAETPIIFSSDGLYRHAVSRAAKDSIIGRLFDTLVHGLIKPYIPLTKDDLRKPFHYRIKKGLTDFRQLAIIHPRSQWDVRQFYKDNEAIILYYCGLSPFTIRAPRRQASSFYLPSGTHASSEVKGRTIALSDTDPFLMHSPSFFSYRGYDRLYQFFKSDDFLILEKRYKSYFSLDVSKCFDSIYTHSISWAIKDKLSAKLSRLITPTFGELFDSLMQTMNFKETNGIVIGPEVSRIFAEIILQSVDMNVLGILEDEADLIYERDYVIRRYVDDVFIFSASTSCSDKIAQYYRDALSKMKLHTNDSKTMRMERPFITAKSHIINEVSSRLDIFFRSFLEDDRENNALKPKKIHGHSGLVKSFIDAIKSVCFESCASYADVSTFIIGAIRKRVDKLTRKSLATPSIEETIKYRDALLVLFDVAFFFYTASPSVNESYRLSAAIVMTARFVRNSTPEHYGSIAEQLFSLTVLLAESEGMLDRSVLSNLVRLETINILIAVKEWGNEYRISEALTRRLFNADRPNYLEIVACFFYIQESPDYAKLRAELQTAVDRYLDDLTDVHQNTEKACLLLDILTCPYVSRMQKASYLTKLYPVFNLSGPNEGQLNQFFKGQNSGYWFVNWNGVDILHLLEKKELVVTY